MAPAPELGPIPPLPPFSMVSYLYKMFVPNNIFFKSSPLNRSNGHLKIDGQLLSCCREHIFPSIAEIDFTTHDTHPLTSAHHHLSP